MTNQLFLALFCFAFACNKTQETKTTKPTITQNNFDWLLGKWQRLNDTDNKTTFENWQKINNTTYSGIGFSLQNGDTVSQEKMMLKQNAKNWILSVKTPEEKQPTLFKLDTYNATSFTFKNDSIAFPNVINYKKTDRLLHAKISNKNMSIDFEFKKIE